MFGTATTLALLATTLYFLCKLVYEIFFYWDNRQFPRVSLKKNLSDLLNIVLCREPYETMLDEIYKEMKDERLYGFIHLFAPTILVRDPELINRILIKDFTYFEDRGMTADAEADTLAASLPQMKGNHWRYLRHKLTPIFTSSKLKLMVGQISGCSESLVHVMKTWERKGQPLDSALILNKYTLSVIGSTAFGLHFDTVKGCQILKREFIDRTQRFFEPSFYKIMKNLFMARFPKISSLLRLRFIDEDTERFFTTVVCDTIKDREKTGARRNDFIQLMMDLRDKEIAERNSHEQSSSAEKTNGFKKKAFSEEDQEDEELFAKGSLGDPEDGIPDRVFTESCIVANSFLFITSGTEQTASVLGYAFYHIAADPVLQTQLQEEIESVMSGNELDYNAIKQLTFMDQVIYEVLRLHPPNGSLLRVCKKDFPIPDSDKYIRKGERLLIPISSIQRDPKYFPDPDNFDPSRFKDIRTIPKGVYLPFGEGPRMCIAVRLAMMKVKIFLCKFLHSFNMSLHENTQLPLQISTKSYIKNVKGGVWITYEERQ